MPLKEFFKYDKFKLAIFLLIALIYAANVFYQAFALHQEVVHLRPRVLWNFVLLFSWLFGYPIDPILGRMLMIINVGYWYLLSCLIVFIYKKLRRG